MIKIPSYEVLQQRADRRKFLRRERAKVIQDRKRLKKIRWLSRKIVIKPLKEKTIKIRNTKTIEKRRLERLKLLTPCLGCGNTDLRLINLHHVNKFKFPDLVMPLCWNCHMLFHRVAGHRNKNESALEVLEILKKARI